MATQSDKLHARLAQLTDAIHDANDAEEFETADALQKEADDIASQLRETLPAFELAQ